ncbi:MAG TPA: TfoX/Sxy family DNA transformation protein [Candidatus Brocadiia bacterium]|nr:TfoX/Sxy family DNA transformation protein [Candidatus Brocadiia bacterium]
MGHVEDGETLEQMPNIGAKCAGLLRDAGIKTPEQLRRIGSVAAALRLKAVMRGDSPCRSKLSALEGAIRGIRWRSLPKAERDRLWEEYQRMQARQ